MRGLQLHPGFRQRVLYALVLAYGATKHLTRLGIAGGAAQTTPSIAVKPAMIRSKEREREVNTAKEERL